MEYLFLGIISYTGNSMVSQYRINNDLILVYNDLPTSNNQDLSAEFWTTVYGNQICCVQLIFCSQTCLSKKQCLMMLMIITNRTLVSPGYKLQAPVKGSHEDTMCSLHGLQNFMFLCCITRIMYSDVFKLTIQRKTKQKKT